MASEPTLRGGDRALRGVTPAGEEQVRVMPDFAIPIIPGDDALDSEYAARVRPLVEQAIAAGAGRIVFDLAACSFVERFGMAVLLYGVLSVTRAGGRAGVVVTDPHVRDTLVMMGFEEMPGVAFYPSVEAALAALTVE